MVIVVTIVAILGIFQFMQWIKAIMNLGYGDFSCKTEFIVALIPGRFIHSTAKKIWELAEDFVKLE